LRNSSVRKVTMTSKGNSRSSEMVAYMTNSITGEKKIRERKEVIAVPERASKRRPPTSH